MSKLETPGETTGDGAITDVQAQPPLDPEGLLPWYEHALIHMAWRGGPNAQGDIESLLLFAMVELLPREFPCPVAEPGPKDGFKVRGTGTRLRVGRFPTSAQQGLEWYKLLSGPSCTFPPKYGDDRQPPALTVPSFTDEPSWPGVYTCSTNVHETLPFIPQNHVCPKVHHRLDIDEQVFGTIHGQREKEVLSFLSAQLRFDLHDYREFVGSAHLVCPNPVFQPPEIHGTKDGVKIFVVPRASRPENADLTVRVAHHNLDGILSTVEYPLVRRSECIHFGRKSQRVHVAISSPQHGLLFWHKEPMSWVERVESNMGMVVAQHDIRVHDANGIEIDQHVRQIRKTERIVVGGKPPKDVRRFLGKYRSAREQRRVSRRLGQQFFREQASDAAQAVRKVLHRARNRLIIVDPYFGANEVPRFALAAGEVGLTVSVLTSAMFLRHKFQPSEPQPDVPSSDATTQPADSGGGDDTGDLQESPASRTQADLLREQLEDLGRKLDISHIDIRVMPGSKKPPIHDRFLVIDDEVWLLGSSLNNYGEAGTMMVRIPHPDEVREAITQQYEKAVTFDDWQKASNPQPGDSGG
ncbi:VPA1262 family N-terminal domain-containing protein [Myxococcota bacterium]